MSFPRTALITGGSLRIGKAICEGLSAAGYAVAVHYHSSSNDAHLLVDEIRAAGGKAVAVQADLTDSVAVRNVMADANKALGPIGLLVNNASVFESDSFEVDDEILWNTHFDVHVKAPSVLTAAQYDQLPQDTQGLAVNIIDQRVWKLTPAFSSYTLSKSALWTATRTMAQTFAPRLRVNAIGPGPTLPSPRQSQESFQKQVDTLLLKRAPDLVEFTRTILYLAETGSVTGQMIALDGGQHLAWDTGDQRVEE
ncbi:MAG: SDR family oxidoreductase [Rhizobiaceae bacterium]